MSLRRLFSIVLKELRQLRRDRLTFGMIIGIPTMQLLLFGFAINLDVRHLDTAVLDQADTARSREFVAEIAASQVINLRQHLSAPQQLDELMRQGKIGVGIVIPADFDNRLERGDRMLTEELVRSHAVAVSEVGGVDDKTIVSWVNVPRTGALVGHTDTFAVPGAE